MSQLPWLLRGKGKRKELHRRSLIARKIVFSPQTTNTRIHLVDGKQNHSQLVAGLHSQSHQRGREFDVGVEVVGLHRLLSFAANVARRQLSLSWRFPVAFSSLSCEIKDTKLEVQYIGAIK